MECDDGKFRTVGGVSQKCIGGIWVDMPMPPPESTGIISAQREIESMEELRELEAAVKSAKKRVLVQIEDVETEDE